MTATFTPICWVGSYEIWHINDDYFFILHNEVLMDNIDLSLSRIWCEASNATNNITLREWELTMGIYPMTSSFCHSKSYLSK